MPLNVVRTSLWIDPSFDAVLQPDARVRLAVMGIDDTPEVWQSLGQAQVYHCSAAKDELPAHLHVRAPLIERCPQLLVASSSGAGYDTIDVPACTEAGIAVVNQAGGNAVSVAEHTLGLLLGVSRRMAEGDRLLRRERGFSREDVMGHEIAGKTIGLVGIGHIGARVARLAQAFGLHVLACDPLLDEATIRARGAEPCAFDALLEASDVVSMHCPRDASTLRLMNAQAFARMKQGAIFINTARGGIHDEAALVQALRSGHLAGAGIDVWDQEPPALDHPLLTIDTVYATFHTGGVTHECRRNIATIAAQQILQIAAGQTPARLVNPQVWPRVLERLQRLID
ncbi:MAG: hydroxyacid dehydrogenase [Burkholderiales bacterium]